MADFTTSYDQDDRVVLTLDAGGTNFVFSAMQGNEEVIEPITLPARTDELDFCLDTFCEGFEQARKSVDGEPVAISFAMPGPADYANGIIGDLPNLPAFRGGVALGPMLEEQFEIPVFINNDGDLFAYGEAIAGLLPFVNRLLEEAGHPKRYHNLFGVTLGTGFGGGIARNGELYRGDNDSAAEVWVFRNKLDPDWCGEECASIRAVKRTYASETEVSFEEAPDPKYIYQIALGEREGDRTAARTAYERLGEGVGAILADVINLLDGLVVIGGGLAGAQELFLPPLIEEMNGTFDTPDGNTLPRMVLRAYNLETEKGREQFISGELKEIDVPRTNRKMKYDSLRRTGVATTRLGTSTATSIGAYVYALNQLDG